MTCRDFERAWNELIDADASATSRSGRGAQAAQLSPDQVGRARACLAGPCGRVPGLPPGGRAVSGPAAGDSAWGPPPAPPAGLADRILAEIQTPTPSAWAVYGDVSAKPSRPPCAATSRRSRRSSAAIALCLAVLNRAMRPTQRNRPPAVLHPHPSMPTTTSDSETIAVDARTLNMALAEATAATWDLARSASEPAARISRQVLDAATGPDREPSLAGVGRRLGTGQRRRSRSRRWIRSPPTRPPRGRCCNRSATASRPAFALSRIRPATRSVSCSGRRSPSPMSPLTRQPKREPDGIKNHEICLANPAISSSRSALPVSGSFFSLLVASAARGRTYPAPADALLRLVPPDAAVVVTVEGLRDQASAFLKSRLAADLRRLPAVRAWFASEKYRQFERLASPDRDAAGREPDRPAR